MEPNVTICCGKKDKRSTCIDLIIVILSILFVFVLGIILGAVTGIVDTIGLVYFQALVTVFAVLTVLLIIYRFCIGRNRSK